MEKTYSGKKVNILWFRLDLRLENNPALQAALATRLPIIPLYIGDPAREGYWAPGAASRWWLHRSLAALDEELHKKGSALIIRAGNTEAVLKELITQYPVHGIYWNHRYEPALREKDIQLQKSLESHGIQVNTFHGNLLYNPDALLKKDGTPFKVFTPFWKNCQSFSTQELPEYPCSTLPPLPSKTESLPLNQLHLNPQINWDTGLRKSWQPGSRQAIKQLNNFLNNSLSRYSENRDRTDWEGTSRLSPYLHFGEISPLRIWQECQKLEIDAAQPGLITQSEAYLRQLGWREFAYHLLIHFPQTPEHPLREEFRRFPWAHQPELLKAWQQGKTGYPIIDAGMRQLWQTGWMHNRVRMIVASFLVKDLLHSWQAGAAWFWETLVDADLANNTFGWQWAGGCGADAAPYFRIFNPVLQGEKFDSRGTYVKTYCPELRNLSPKYLHKPWLAPSAVLTSAGIVLGKNYPLPLVDHARARHKALFSFSHLTK